MPGASVTLSSVLACFSSGENVGNFHEPSKDSDPWKTNMLATVILAISYYCKWPRMFHRGDTLSSP